MTATDAVARLLDRLDGVKPMGSGWTARCPSHEDHHNSLKVDVGKDGRALVHCYAGCEPNTIVDALGLTLSDLYPPRTETISQNGHGTGPRLVATYDYVDERGALLYQVLRYAPKDFRQRRPDGNGGWSWKLGDVRRVLYRWPDLLAADPSLPVFIPEGEKDVERLIELGFVATTNAQGAGKWRPEYTRALQGRHVILVPDNDEPGERHVQLVAQSLYGVAADVRMLRLPGLLPKGDVSDWLAAGGTRECLARLIADAPVWEPAATASASGASAKTSASRIITANALSTKSFPEPRWAVPGVVPDGATVLVGAPKKGKSWLLLGLGIAIAAGGRALGKIAVDAGDVLLLCLEDNQRRLQERLWRVLDGESAPDRLHLVTEWPRLGEGADTALDAWLTEHPTTRLVGIDVLARLRPPSNSNGNLYQLDYWTLASLKAVADRHGVALIVVHHSRKATADDPLDTISGTAGLAGAADTALILTREKGRADGNLYVRGRDVPEADYALGFDPVTCQWDLLGDAAEYRLTAGRAEVLTLLRDRGPLPPKDIAETLGAERGNMRVLLHRMKNAGEVEVSDGIYHAPPSSPVTGVTPPENGVTMPNSPVTTPVTPPEDVTPPCNREKPITTRKSDPVTPVTPERVGVSLNGHVPPGQARPNTVRVSVA